MSANVVAPWPVGSGQGARGCSSDQQCKSNGSNHAAPGFCLSKAIGRWLWVQRYRLAELRIFLFGWR
jgi:hypothetical protein